MLRKVEPPNADPSIDLTAPHPELTAGVYRGLEALLDLYKYGRPPKPDDAYFWSLVIDRLHAVSFAPLGLARAIAGGLDDLAWHYEVRGWLQEAEGWRQAAKLVDQRACAREAQAC